MLLKSSCFSRREQSWQGTVLLVMCFVLFVCLFLMGQLHWSQAYQNCDTVVVTLALVCCWSRVWACGLPSILCLSGMVCCESVQHEDLPAACSTFTLKAQSILKGHLIKYRSHVHLIPFVDSDFFLDEVVARLLQPSVRRILWISVGLCGSSLQ